MINALSNLSLVKQHTEKFMTYQNRTRDHATLIRSGLTGYLVMRKLIIVALFLVLGLLFWANSLPGLPNYEHLCPDSKPVIVDNKHVGCLNDKYTADPVWTPKTGPSTILQRCEYCDSRD